MTDAERARPVVLTIAGSDSGGGAGIQADLKAISAMGGWGASAITCLTSQNLAGVRSVQPTEPGILADQIDAVCEGFEVRAVKTGMLYSSDLIQVVIDRLRVHHTGPVVVDPVMVATSGAKLLQDSAIEILRDSLLPMASLVTPNLHEAEILVPDNELQPHFEVAYGKERAKLEIKGFRKGKAPLSIIKKMYGDPDALITTIKGWGIAKAEFIQTRSLPFIPRLLKAPFILGTMAMIRGEK